MRASQQAVPSPPPAPATLSDEELMGRIKAQSDAEAFAVLYDRYAARALGRARTLCDTTERAEEAVQDAFLSLWRTRASYEQGRGGVQPWLFALLRNRSFDIYRRNRRADRLRASDAGLVGIATAGSVEDDAVRHSEGDRVRASLRKLPVGQREAVVLAYFGGLTQSEIAARLDLPLGTVKGRIRAGLRKAREELESPQAAAIRTRAAAN